MSIKKVMIPVAGWGTRLLPATKNVPKEMLPVYNKPVIQYIVEEAMAAGCTDVIFINNQNKKIIEDHFDYNLALESVLESAHKIDLLREVRAVADMVSITSVRQKKQLGLGHAVLCAKELVKHDPFAIMVGDDLMFGTEPGIKQLIDVATSEQLPVVGVMEVAPEKTNRYGIIHGDEFASGLFRVHDLVEKPAIGKAPSCMAIVGRYVLFPEIFKHLEKQQPGVDGEIQLTDALQEMARRSRLLAVKIRGKRFDAGDWLEYLMANIYFVLQDKKLRYKFIKKLKHCL